MTRIIARSLCLLLLLTTLGSGCSKSLIGGPDTDSDGLSGSGGGAGAASGAGSLAGSCTGGGQIDVGGTCVCPGTANFDGSNCVQCTTNQLWNSSTKTCSNTCSAGSYATPSGGCTTCPANQSWDGTQCVPSTGTGSLPPQVCNSYQQLTSPFAIPARDGTDTCYYIKLSSAVSSQSPSNFTTHDTNVLTANAANTSSKTLINPYIIGSTASSKGALANIEFLIEGQRQIILSGNTSGTANVTIDSFVLLEIGMNGAMSYFGEGDGNSVPSTGYITANGTNVTDFIVGTNSGNSSFAAKDLQPQFQLDTTINLKSEALSSCSTADVSDIYLLFR